MASKIEITNIALIRLGASPISSFEEGSTVAIAAGVVWDTARTSLLRDHPWNFAIKDIEVPQSSTAPKAKYKYKYQLPSDCLRLLEVYDDHDFKLKGREIHTDMTSCKIKYVSDITDTAIWDSAFTDLMAAKLAFELAYPVTESTSLMQQMGEIYALKIQKARFVDATEDVPENFTGMSSLISVRF